MEHAEYIERFRRDGAAFGAAARAAGVGAPVTSCGDWTVGDLCAHVGRLHRWAASIIDRRPKDPDDHWKQLSMPEGEALYGWFDEGCAHLADTLAATDPAEPAWSWTSDRTVGFWSRRQSNELAVHRWDAELAAGAPQPIDAALAADGIQELFDILPYRPGGPPAGGHGETMHLHCTDVDGEWLVRLDPDGVSVVNEHAKGDVAARGTASDLLLMMWGRVDPEQLEVFGDASLLRRWSDGKL